MKTLDEKISDHKRWKEAEKSVEEFKKMMEIIKPYMPEPKKRAPPSPPYTIPGHYKY